MYIYIYNFPHARMQGPTMFLILLPRQHCPPTCLLNFRGPDYKIEANFKKENCILILEVLSSNQIL